MGIMIMKTKIKTQQSQYQTHTLLLLVSFGVAHLGIFRPWQQ
jgi:hypothetical protein